MTRSDLCVFDDQGRHDWSMGEIRMGKKLDYLAWTGATGREAQV
jgi:hypothetical protein